MTVDTKGAGKQYRMADFLVMFCGIGQDKIQVKGVEAEEHGIAALVVRKFYRQPLIQ